jgi:DNA-binding NarL/FixJ family response regulator
MSQRSVLVIDDDPTIARTVALLLPECRIIAAHNGVDGIAMVRAAPDAFAMVVLDLQMPHAGVHVAAQIRALAPQVRILPYSGLPSHQQELLVLGCAELLPKTVPMDEQRDYMRQVLDGPPPTQPDHPLLPLLLHHATESEQRTRQQQAQICRVALLATSSLHNVLATALLSANADVCVNALTGQMLRTLAPRMRAALIVVDMRSLAEAAPIAHACTLPLVAVTFSLAAGYLACSLAQGVIVDPAQTAVFTTALATVARGEHYHDPALLAPLRQSQLTERECDVAYRLLQGMTVEEIAPLCGMSPVTARYHQRNICDKLGLKSPGQLLAWAETHVPEKL